MIIHVDYSPCEKCNNTDTWGMICVKCGECGRQFNENGICTNIKDYPADDESEVRRMARLIDADALKARIGELCLNNDDMFSARAYERIIGVIESMPNEAEPARHGEWHECWHTDKVCASICTNCGKAATQSRVIVGQELMTNVRYPLCPHCGARMDGGDAE